MLISVVIPSYKRNQVLCDTVEYLLSLKYKPLEIIIVDQSPNHDPNTEDFLKSLHSKNQINWIKKKKPSTYSILRMC